MLNEGLLPPTDEPKPKPIDGQGIARWQEFQKWMAENGHAGNPALDHDRTLGLKLMAAYNEQHPDRTVSEDHIKAVQAELNRLDEATRQRAAAKGKEGYIVAKPSKVDGWLGSKTSQYAFPSQISEQYHNGALKDRTYDGLLNGLGVPVKGGSAAPEGIVIPKGVSSFTDDKGGVYFDLADGDTISADDLKRNPSLAGKLKFKTP